MREHSRDLAEVRTLIVDDETFRQAPRIVAGREGRVLITRGDTAYARGPAGSLLEGEAGVGKTEIAKVLSSTLARHLIRLQCYEGLDVSAAVYEWNYAAQMIAIRVAEAEGAHDRERLEHDVFSERFLIKRPLLQALEPDPAGPPVLLIDELDRADEPFEAFLLEVLADYQITVPELGPIRARQIERTVVRAATPALRITTGYGGY